MHKAEDLTQDEGRTAQVNVKMTPSEKEACRCVAAVDRMSESDLFYRYVPQIVRRAREIWGRESAA